jgi:hypothetical protein
VVEIDLIRDGDYIVLAPEDQIRPSQRAPYVVSVWRATRPDVLYADHQTAVSTSAVEWRRSPRSFESRKRVNRLHATASRYRILNMQVGQLHPCRLTGNV